jgi:hypothetical protein
MTQSLRVVLLGAILVSVFAACVFCGFAWGAYVQFRHIVFLHQNTVGRDIVEAKLCALQGCDIVRDWVIADLPLQLSNYASQYAVLNEPFPHSVIDIAHNTWRMRHSVDEAIKSPARI